MSIHWDSAKDLQLMKLILERESFRRGDAALANLKGEVRLAPHPYRDHLSELTVHLTLGHKVEIDLIEVISRSEASLDEIARASDVLLEGIDDIDRASDALVEEIVILRTHLRKKIAAERRKGARVKASIGIGRVEADYARDIGPILTLDYIREDLRVHRAEFNIDTAAQIDEVFDELRGELLLRSDQLKELDVIGAVGQVHPLFVHALHQRNLPIEETLRSIHRDLDRSQSIRMEDGNHIIVYWKNGLLTGTCILGDGIRFQERRIRLDPENKTVPMNAKGREIADLIECTPPLPSGVRIETVRKKEASGQELVLEATPIPFDSEGNLLN